MSQEIIIKTVTIDRKNRTVTEDRTHQGELAAPTWFGGWVDACKQLPDSDTTVLIHCPISDDPVWIGYHDGEMWRQIDGEALPDDFVDHWAELPEPPPLPWHTDCPPNE
jgi:hypothetical protein